MNYYQNKLTQIKIALGLEVKMAEAVLEDGVTKVEAEAFEPGMKIFVVSEAGEKAPAPEGTHTTQDGIKVTVDAEGTITAVEKPEPKVEVEVEAAVEEEVKMEDKPADVEAIIEEKMKEMMENVMMAVEEVAKEVGIIKEEMAAYKAKMEKMSKTPAAAKLTTFNKEAAKAENSIEARMEAIARLKESLASKKRKF
jgi:hypothetical protein